MGFDASHIFCQFTHGPLKVSLWPPAQSWTSPVFENACHPAQVRAACAVERRLMQKVRLTRSSSSRVHRVQGHFSPLSSRSAALVPTNNVNIVPSKAAQSQMQTRSLLLLACVM